ncbi:hypothetical protein Hanom_Chr02g00111391 [Helianthus anomalus]
MFNLVSSHQIYENSASEILNLLYVIQTVDIVEVDAVLSFMFMIFDEFVEVDAAISF